MLPGRQLQQSQGYQELMDKSSMTSPFEMQSVIVVPSSLQETIWQCHQLGMDFEGEDEPLLSIHGSQGTEGEDLVSTQEEMEMLTEMDRLHLLLPDTRLVVLLSRIKWIV